MGGHIRMSRSESEPRRPLLLYLRLSVCMLRSTTQPGSILQVCVHQFNELNEQLFLWYTTAEGRCTIWHGMKIGIRYPILLFHTGSILFAGLLVRRG